MMNRRQIANLFLAAPIAAAGCSPRADAPATATNAGFSYLPGITTAQRLVAPAGRQIKVAFAINPGFQVIDVAGPWETFQDTYLSEEAEEPAFAMYTVSESVAPLRGSAA